MRIFWFILIHDFIITEMTNFDFQLVFKRQKTLYFLMSKKENSASQQESQISLIRRKRLTKQRCRQIDNEIADNVSRLNQLIHIIHMNKYKNCQEEPNQQQTHIISNNDHIKNQTIRSKRFDFRYSIKREYKFVTVQNYLPHSDFFKTYDKLLKIVEKDKEIETCSQEQQENLLESQTNWKTSIQQKTQNIRNLTKINNIKFNLPLTKLEKPESISVLTRHCWIKDYLDHQLNDTITKGIIQKTTIVQILKFNEKRNIFQCKTGLNKTESKAMLDKTNVQNFIANDKVQKYGNIDQPNQQKFLQCEYNNFMNENKSVLVEFPKHSHLIKILNAQQKPKVVKISTLDSNGFIRILVKNQNKSNKMQRILIFKQINQSQSCTDLLLNQSRIRTAQEKEKRKIIWARYQKQNFTEDILLQNGFNYLIANICNSPSSDLAIIFNPVDLDNISIQTTDYDPQKSYNLLCSSFHQCLSVFRPFNENTKSLEFIRNNFLDLGLVMEIYQNIYQENVVFLQNTEKKEKKAEDILLLFSQLYTKLQCQNIYQPNEIVIKFFQVTQKPAKLYFPKKNVLVGSKMVDHVTIHSTFK